MRRACERRIFYFGYRGFFEGVAVVLRFRRGGTGTSPPYGEGPAALSARRAGVRRAGGQGLVPEGQAVPVTGRS
ncbi:hypothetical protein EQG64_22510 [Streptomyces sp. S6]|nr:hypothetical protein EQG64_22510 [Streptomyces sp. S6]